MKRKRRVKRKAGKSAFKSELDQFRNLLGIAATGFTDGQLRQLRAEMTAAAELLLDIYMLGDKGPVSSQAPNFDRDDTEG